MNDVKVSINTITNKHYLIFSLCILLSNPVNPLDTATLDVGGISGKDWKLEGVRLSLTGLNQNKLQFKLSAARFKLPKPFHDLALANIVCNQFTWDHGEVECNQGRASVQSAYWQSPKTFFSFHLGNKKNTFRLEDARLMGSRLTLEANVNGDDWQCKLRAKHINNELLDKLFQTTPIKGMRTHSKNSSLNLSGTITGQHNAVHGFSIDTEIARLTDQTHDGKIASEKLNLLVHLDGKKTTADNWYWHSKSQMTSGALYVDPVYLEAGANPIVLAAQGVWNTGTKKADILSFTYRHPDTGSLSGNVTGYYRDGIKIDKADVTLHSETLQNLFSVYINPFFAESPLTGITVTGGIRADFSFIQQTLTETSINFSKLNVVDETERLAIVDGNGLLNWSDDAMQIKQSELAWQQLAFKGLPVDAAKLKFTSRSNHFWLAEKVKLPVLSGNIKVDKFSWQNKKRDEPDVAFAGSIDKVSLEQLSKTLGWTPLSGKISGHIPGIVYHGKTLTLEGGLSINVFDGVLKVNHLSSSGLFSGFPRLKGDIEIQDLDLDQLTSKFEFGNITGRLSGSINGLILENWHPVTFFAWLETPDDDDSAHTISQKAVNNIASIGGGASNLLSRSFLKMFDTFRYDKIGFGCYLSKGVCQMMGMEPSGEKYYLIKGGGLPRIDVVGYNSRINWDVLVERLGRLASTDNMVVK